MYEPSPYLLWARRYYGTVPYDMAASGMPTASREMLGMPASIENPRAWDELRAAIAAYNDVPLGESIAALGTSHALWLAYAALLSPGDELLLENPFYEPMALKARAQGVNVVHFDRLASDGYALDVARIAKAMTTKTRVVAITNLHNPTGVRASDDSLRELAAMCAKRKATLLVDEVYAPFDGLVDAGGVFRKSARKLAPNIVAVSSLTKCFGLGLERIGWVLGPPSVIERASQAVTLTAGMLPLSHANLAVHAFSRIGTLADRARKVLAGKRELVEAWVASRPDLAWSAPEEGLFALVTTSRRGDITPAIEAGIASHGVLVTAGAFFGVPNGFRISWSLPVEKLEEALTRLDAVLPSTSKGPAPKAKAKVKSATATQKAAKKQSAATPRSKRPQG